MSFKNDNTLYYFQSTSYDSKRIERVLPISISPIDYARANGSNNNFTFEPFQITNIRLSSVKCFSPNKYCIINEIPTIKLK